MHIPESSYTRKVHKPEGARNVLTIKQAYLRTRPAVTVTSVILNLYIVRHKHVDPRSSQCPGPSLHRCVSRSITPYFQFPDRCLDSFRRPGRSLHSFGVQVDLSLVLEPQVDSSTTFSFKLTLFLHSFFEIKEKKILRGAKAAEVLNKMRP